MRVRSCLQYTATEVGKMVKLTKSSILTCVISIIAGCKTTAFCVKACKLFQFISLTTSDDFISSPLLV